MPSLQYILHPQHTHTHTHTHLCVCTCVTPHRAPCLSALTACMPSLALCVCACQRACRCRVNSMQRQLECDANATLFLKQRKLSFYLDRVTDGAPSLSLYHHLSPHSLNSLCFSGKVVCEAGADKTERGREGERERGREGERARACERESEREGKRKRERERVTESAGAR